MLALHVLLAAAPPHHHVHPGFADSRLLLHESATEAGDQLRRITSLQAAAVSALQVASPNATRFIPAAYGADPTGRVPSSNAFDAAVAAMLEASERKTADGFADLGGAILDLDGCMYMLTRPVLFPGGYANYRI